MRRILVDHARARQAAKRGGGAPVAPLEEAWVVSPEPDADVVAVDEALSALSKVDPRKARVVELRFFGGLSVEETAAVLEISEESVMRDWRLAKAWLARELKPGETCMDPERWRKIEALYEAALGVDACPARGFARRELRRG